MCEQLLVVFRLGQSERDRQLIAFTGVNRASPIRDDDVEWSLTQDVMRGPREHQANMLLGVTPQDCSVAPEHASSSIR
jgi:hypothetical protein